MWSAQTLHLIEAAYDEDLSARGDLTSHLLPEPDALVTARVVPRKAGAICGLALGPAICDVFARRLRKLLTFATEIKQSNAIKSAEGANGTNEEPLTPALSPEGRGGKTAQDGDLVAARECVATLSGPRAAVLMAERTLLNFLCRMSGVATLTRKFVEAAARRNPQCKIYDTRKTLPGWRELDKYAIRCGGGHNHRFGLYDAVLIKDNHIAGVPPERLAETLTEFLRRLPELTGSAAVIEEEIAGKDAREGGGEKGFSHQQMDGSEKESSHQQEKGASRQQTRQRQAAAPPTFVEVEVDSLEQFAEVRKVAGVDIVLLDNFSPAQMREAVRLRDAWGLRGKLELEASGGVTLETVAEIAATGVDRIAVGALTHSAPALDLGLDFAVSR